MLIIILSNHTRSKFLEKMIRLEDNYFSINKILLLIIGLRPYKQTKLVWLRFILFSSILISSIIFQVRQYISIIIYASILHSCIILTYNNSLLTKIILLSFQFIFTSILNTFSYILLFSILFHTFLFNIICIINTRYTWHNMNK